MNPLSALRFGVALLQVGGELVTTGIRAFRKGEKAAEDGDERTNRDKLQGQAAGSSAYSESKRKR